MLKNLVYCIILFVTGVSCSETLQRNYDRRHGTYSGDRYSRAERDRINRREDAASRSAYRRDYDRVTADDLSIRAGSGGGTGSNAQLLVQYEDMDKVGEVIIYELDVLERRWNVLLNEYKTADQTQKETISTELDQISADQITLYKAYTRIYREGKTNWPIVKRDVENTLRTVRKVADK
ncbi:hypothetical protein FEM33_01945 [Dyadobacter flavalbus]|uniref:Uncharacterized protein n=1 Tax=Dyadobacter flavalbus TaxID=2579942 RepID=A0A5M8R3L0_9BACT|nr:hypothetical protein FEM33_01945 [Dyadobacter flavalbus]